VVALDAMGRLGASFSEIAAERLGRRDRRLGIGAGGLGHDRDARRCEQALGLGLARVRLRPRRSAFRS
jgi:hypothetical protein